MKAWAWLATASLVGSTALLGACSSGTASTPTTTVTTAAATRISVPNPLPDPDTGIPDYADPDNWLAQASSIDFPTDVFYLFPTTYAMPAGGSAYAPIDDSQMREGARYVYDVQATAMAGDANMFAPFYRQVDANAVMGQPTYELQDAAFAAVPTVDVTAAFDYYITHLNDGRPFILYGHSQGAVMTRNLLAGYLKDHPEVYARMIAAYPIGFAITEDYLAANPNLAFAEGAADTGVVISWNTEAPGMSVANPLVRPGAISINPITWTRGEELAPASESLGSWLPDASGEFVKVMDYASAQVDLERGVVVAAEPAVVPDVGSGRWPDGVLHSFDIPFYYFNLGENAMVRTDAFLASHD